MDLINLYVKSVRDVDQSSVYTGFTRRVYELTTFILIIPDCDNESNFYEEIQFAMNEADTDRDLFNETYLMIGAKPSYKVRNPAFFVHR